MSNELEKIINIKAKINDQENKDVIERIHKAKK